MQTKRRKPPHYKDGTKIRPYQFDALIVSHASGCDRRQNQRLVAQFFSIVYFNRVNRDFAIF